MKKIKVTITNIEHYGGFLEVPDDFDITDKWGVIEEVNTPEFMNDDTINGGHIELDSVEEVKEPRDPNVQPLKRYEVHIGAHSPLQGAVEVEAENEEAAREAATALFHDVSLSYNGEPILSHYIIGVDEIEDPENDCR